MFNTRRMRALISTVGDGHVVPIVLACLALLAGPAGWAPADNLDEALIRHAPRIIKHLQENDCRNVGVLAFRVKNGDAKPNFDGGLLTSNMPARLENSLVLALNPEAEPIGIIRDASSVAGRHLHGASYRTPEDRKKLFDLKYPLAWGRQQVEPDVFLAGMVTISRDRRTTNVRIETFDRRNPGQYRKVLDFDVKTDRYILADAGQGFSTSKGRAAFSRGASDDDIIVSFDTNLQDDDPTKKKDGDDPKKSDGREPLSSGSSSTSEFPVELKVRYKDEVQTMRSDPDNPGPHNWVIDDPKEGTAVTFDVTNKTKDALGIVLTVNGISTLFEETGQPTQMTKWILEPGKLYRIKGFHQKDMSKYITIEGLPEKLSEERFEDLGGPEKAGILHLYVFRKADGQLASAPSFSRSMRRVSDAVLNQAPPQTPAELQALIARSVNTHSGRGLMAWGPDEKVETLNERTLGSTSLTDTMVVRYYKPKNSAQAPDKEK